MKCWICNTNEATSGEHLVKASILRSIFGEVSQAKPLFHSSARRRNRRMQSIDSKLVKLKVLCGDCNSSKTQKMDQAFDEFLRFLERNASNLRMGSKIRLNRVYRLASRKRARDLHLYFVKLFGCVIAEKSIVIDTAPLAKAICVGRVFPSIHVGVGKVGRESLRKMAGVSNVETIVDAVSGVCVYAVWILTLGQWEFQFVYAAAGEKREGLVNAWNPSLARRIVLKSFTPPS